jgi:S1-C subfamily serine protease
VEPAVVDVEDSLAGEGAAAGSGIIITAAGEVLTNNHVVEDATSIEVVIQNRGTHPAKVVAVDPTGDVALLQIEGVGSKLPYASLGDSSKARVGDSIVAIGNALGQGGEPSVVTGIISAEGRTITAADETSAASQEVLHNLLQVTAQIVPGDSGGPLVNTSGQVIGMDTAAASGDSGATFGFAIPINTARNIVELMRQGSTSDGVVQGESAFLGVEFSAINEPSFGFPFGQNSGTEQSPAGAEISGVVADAPAATAGLQAGDVITSFAGQKVTNQASLQTIIGEHRPGDRVAMTYIDTAGSAHTTSVQLAGLPK